MGTRDRRVDAYIRESEDFAKPILRYLRETVHAVVPDVQEGIKWSFPHFDYKGMFCGMASFKKHCTFGFWKGSLVVGPGGKTADAMGQFGAITKVADLPPKSVLEAYIRKAADLNDRGVKVPRKKAVPNPPPRTPAALEAALTRNKRAQSTFAAFSPSHKRDYVEWIAEARGEATRQRRVQTAVEWMAEGRPRNWKCERKR